MLRDKILAVMAEVNSEIAEREEVIHYIAIALLTRKNLFILGDRGQAKSYAINLFRQRIEGSRQFERLISKQTDEEMLFGRLDLSSLIPGSVSTAILATMPEYLAVKTEVEASYKAYASNPDDAIGQKLDTCLEKAGRIRRAAYEMAGSKPSMITAGKIPEAEIIYLDELYKANDGILNALLTALNERKFVNEGSVIGIPAISFFAASNELPDFNDNEGRILRPLHDRFELKVLTGYVQDRVKRLNMLKRKQQVAATSKPAAVITLDELYAMQSKVDMVQVPDAVNELFDDIVTDLRTKGIAISDRKYFNYTPVVKAQCWLSGRSKVIPEDLKVLRNYLWDTPQEIDVINQTLEKFCTNPMRERVLQILQMAEETYSQAMAADEKQPKNMAKFRREMARVFDMHTETGATAVTAKDSHEVENALEQLEEMSRKVHDRYNFTYAPLAEIKQLI
ncbi:MAG: hypothetical protein FIA99_17310 [Ruminiclostridium sp.]|nr:hypothetical protein [Ruminiclostridium sp.]